MGRRRRTGEIRVGRGTTQYREGRSSPLPPGQRAVLAGAERVFDRQGFAATVVSDIVAESGVARGTFYRYFPGKPAAFVTLVSSVVRPLRTALRPNSGDSGPSDPLTRFEQRVRRILEVAAAEPMKTRLLLDYPIGTDGEVDAAVEPVNTAALVEVRTAMTMARHLDLTRQSDLELTSTLVLGAFRASLRSWTYEIHGSDPSLLDRYAADICGFVTHGVLRKDAIITPDWKERTDGHL
jgi:AcrR family transcriptional regulator